MRPKGSALRVPSKSKGAQAPLSACVWGPLGEQLREHGAWVEGTRGGCVQR